RERQLAEFANSLPGSEPYDNVRPIFVPAARAGQSLIDFLAESVPALSRERWEEEIRTGHVLRGDCLGKLGDRVCAGDRYDHVLPDFVEPEISVDLRWVYEDAAVVVIDKPAPLPMHPSGR